jgi:hypothetical protein
VELELLGPGYTAEREAYRELFAEQTVVNST